MSEHLFIKALRGETVERPPVWLMRQAGRYLPEYQVLRKKYDFFERVQTPELACEITIQPIDRIQPDAAILFSDILVIPQALGQEVLMVPGTGPVLPEPIAQEEQIAQLEQITDADSLAYVYDAITVTKKALNNRVPLIGFAGAPFTIMCYMVQGGGSKSFDKVRRLCYERPDLAKRLLQAITTLTIDYLKNQIRAGADAIQVFDSWSGLLGPEEFREFAQPYLVQITQALNNEVPVILFAKGSDYALEDLSHTGASALGLGWTATPEHARALVGDRVSLQGNFDPAKLYMAPARIESEVHRMIDRFGVRRYVANLGHGMLPDIPVEHVQAFVNAVKSYSAK